MAATELTHEEESMLDHIIHIHLAERRYEIAGFEIELSREKAGMRSEAAGSSVVKGAVGGTLDESYVP
jgi:hypothetical protein